MPRVWARVWLKASASETAATANINERLRREVKRISTLQTQGHDIRPTVSGPEEYAPPKGSHPSDLHVRPKRKYQRRFYGNFDVLLAGDECRGGAGDCTDSGADQRPWSAARQRADAGACRRTAAHIGEVARLVASADTRVRHGGDTVRRAVQTKRVQRDGDQRAAAETSGALGFDHCAFERRSARHDHPVPFDDRLIQRGRKTRSRRRVPGIHRFGQPDADPGAGRDHDAFFSAAFGYGNALGGGALAKKA